MKRPFIKAISYILLFSVGIMLILNLRYEPNNRTWTEMLKPYDFFSCSPLLPWLLIAFFTVLGIHLLLTKHFLEVNLAMGMLLILIFLVNWPYLVHHNVFAHNVATIAMLREGHVDTVSEARANLWPGFSLSAGFLMEITGLDVVALNILMLSLFVILLSLLMHCIASKISSITNNRSVMYAPLLMWIFLFNNRVLYEFMFHHQWYAILLFVALVYALIELEQSIGKTKRLGLLVSVLAIFSAMVITHPITGFMSVLMLSMYAILRRSMLSAVMACLCIYSSWWTFVTTTYLRNAWEMVEVFSQGGVISGFFVRSFQTEQVLPFYDAISRNLYKAYYLTAILASSIIVLAVLLKKVKMPDRRLSGIVVVSICAFLGVIVFAPFGIGSVLWEDRVYWHIPVPLAVMSVLGFVIYSIYSKKWQMPRIIGRTIRIILLPIILIGLICSSFLLFEMNYYTLYYSPSRDVAFSKWAVLNSENGTRFAVGQTLRLPEYYAALYGKNISAPAEYLMLTWQAKSLDELLLPLREANMILYTSHLEDSLVTGARNLGYSANNESFRYALNSILENRSIIYNDGRNTGYWG